MAPPLPCSPSSLSLAARHRVHPSLLFLQTKSACFQASTSYRIASLKLHTSRKITTLEVRQSGPHVCNKKTVQMMAMLGNGYVPRVVSLHLSFSSLRIALLRVVTAEKEHDHPSLFTKVDDQLKQVESKGSSEESERGMMCQEEWNILGGRVLASIATILLAACLWATPVHAADALKTCACLLKECRVELARCIADPACAANVACLQTCNDRPDETECQIGCGDLFENSVVDQFNECAVSKKKCVPQKPDDGYFPVPSSTAIVKKFNTSDFDGKWYISSGLNPTFDAFDCQLHEFSSSSNKLTGKISWRIRTPDGGFFTRSTVQNFVQDPNQPGVLYNHDNEFLHYQDDWYILSAKTENKPDDYIFVYYRGRNDAWDGYGGAVVYTRSKTLPPSIVPELKEAAKRAGIDFKKFRATDNTCGPEPPLFARLEKKVEEGEQALVEEVQEIEKKVEEVGKTEMTLLQKLGKGLQELKRDQEYFLKELGDEEKAVLKDLQMEAEQVEKLFGKALPIRKLR